MLPATIFLFALVWSLLTVWDRSNSIPLYFLKLIRERINFKKKKPLNKAVFLFWRSRRDLNSRAALTTYTLSRGASSANLSTTPYGQIMKQKQASEFDEIMAERVRFELTVH